MVFSFQVLSLSCHTTVFMISESSESDKYKVFYWLDRGPWGKKLRFGDKQEQIVHNGENFTFWRIAYESRPSGCTWGLRMWCARLIESSIANNWMKFAKDVEAGRYLRLNWWRSRAWSCPTRSCAQQKCHEHRLSICAIHKTFQSRL
jgi:hypothetical protein